MMEYVVSHFKIDDATNRPGDGNLTAFLHFNFLISMPQSIYFFNCIFNMINYNATKASTAGLKSAPSTCNLMSSN